MTASSGLKNLVSDRDDTIADVHSTLYFEGKPSKMLPSSGTSYTNTEYHQSTDKTALSLHTERKVAYRCH